MVKYISIAVKRLLLVLFIFTNFVTDKITKKNHKKEQNIRQIQLQDTV